MCRRLLVAPLIALLVSCGRLGFDEVSSQDDGSVVPTIDSSVPPTIDSAVAPTLIDRGLVARYYLDEGIAQGVVGSSNGALSLPITDPTGGVQTEALATGRGLRFTQVGGDARACEAISGTSVFTALEGSTTGTIEVVADIVAGDDGRSRLAAIGVAADWSFAVGYSSVDTRFIYSMNVSAFEFGQWVLDGSSQGRVVYTFVYDSTRPDEGDRILMFVNGTAIPGTGTAVPIPLNQGLILGASTLCIGNRPIGNRSLDGGIYYAAMYNSALTLAELAHNAAILEANDDPP